MENNPLPLVHNRANGLKNAVAQTLYQLMQTQSIDDISTRGLIAQAGIGVTSFYRHFRDCYDLMEQLEEQALEQLEAVLVSTRDRGVQAVLLSMLQKLQND